MHDGPQLGVFNDPEFHLVGLDLLFEVRQRSEQAFAAARTLSENDLRRLAQHRVGKEVGIDSRPRHIDADTTWLVQAPVLLLASRAAVVHFIARAAVTT